MEFNIQGKDTSPIKMHSIKSIKMQQIHIYLFLAPECPLRLLSIFHTIKTYKLNRFPYTKWISFREHNNILTYNMIT